MSGELPSLQLKLSAEKYDKIMNIVDKMTGGPNAAAPALPAPEPTEVYVPASVVRFFISFIFDTNLLTFVQPVPSEVVYIDSEEQERK